MLNLNFTKRNTGEKKVGFLKAVFYGPKQKSDSIFVNEIEFTKMFRQSGESSIISLEGEGLKLQAMVQDVTYDPVKNFPIHVDFYIIEKGAKVDAQIPINFVGVSEAVKSLGGTLIKVLHQIHLEAEAADLPHQIEVDLSLLATLDSVIHIQDINFPAGVTLYHIKPEDIVASIVVIKEEDLSAKVEQDLSEIKVEEKGKKEEVESESTQ